jgi:MoaE-MoaD fusion protein
LISESEQVAQMDEKTRITVRVLFFGAARETVGEDAVEIEIRFPATVASAFDDVMESFPTLRKRFERSLLFAVNQEYARPDAKVSAGDELAVFPPVSGGSSAFEQPDNEDFFELTTDPLDVGEVARRIVSPSSGATVTLDGYVREWTKGRRTLYLTYEAYEPMALLEMQRLGAQAHTQFEITHIGIVHRTGRLEIGETSVVISVSAPHRRAAFECCEWAIKELKRSVPIWKKEFYEDGEVWVEGEGASAEVQRIRNDENPGRK